MVFSESVNRRLCVDQIQRFPVAADLLLVAIAQEGFAENNGADASLVYFDAFNPVRRDVLSIKACSRNALSFCGDLFREKSCLPFASPRSERYKTCPGNGLGRRPKVTQGHHGCCSSRTAGRELEYRLGMILADQSSSVRVETGTCPILLRQLTLLNNRILNAGRPFGGHSVINLRGFGLIAALFLTGRCDGMYAITSLA